MPELPEIETTKLGIAPLVTGQRISAVKIYQPQLRWAIPQDFAGQISDQIILEVSRRARYLIFHLELGSVIFHFGMTGSLRALRGTCERKKHDHVVIHLTPDTTLLYHDPRRFGSLCYTTEPIAEHPLLVNLGPEPLSEDFSADYLTKKLQHRRGPIKVALMDNELVVGVGNIYSNEVLFRAGISPMRLASEISPITSTKLISVIKTVLQEAIQKGGSTLRDYVNSSGKSGHFQLNYHVYGRNKQPCLICGVQIVRLKQGGRSSFYCPSCQR